MYGIQTSYSIKVCKIKFENDVKMYGIQTMYADAMATTWFENDVKMYGIQTFSFLHIFIG